MPQMELPIKALPEVRRKETNTLPIFENASPVIEKNSSSNPE
jgi:hypothetical protein